MNMAYEINGYKINNVPEYAIEEVEQNGYVIVARYVNDELWFYGAYPEEKAITIAQEVCGWIIKPYEK